MIVGVVVGQGTPVLELQDVLLYILICFDRDPSPCLAPNLRVECRLVSHTIHGRPEASPAQVLAREPASCSLPRASVAAEARMGAGICPRTNPPQGRAHGPGGPAHRGVHATTCRMAAPTMRRRVAGRPGGALDAAAPTARSCMLLHKLHAAAQAAQHAEYHRLLRQVGGTSSRRKTAAPRGAHARRCKARHAPNRSAPR